MPLDSFDDLSTPPLSDPTSLWILSLNKPPSNNLNLIKCYKNVIEHTEMVPEELVCKIVDFRREGKPTMTSSLWAQEFRRFLRFLAPMN